MPTKNSSSSIGQAVLTFLRLLCKMPIVLLLFMDKMTQVAALDSNATCTPHSKIWYSDDDVIIDPRHTDIDEGRKNKHQTTLDITLAVSGKDYATQITRAEWCVYPNGHSIQIGDTTPACQSLKDAARIANAGVFAKPNLTEGYTCPVNLDTCITSNNNMGGDPLQEEKRRAICYLTIPPNNALGAGVIIGIILGSLGCAALIVTALYHYYCKARKHIPEAQPLIDPTQQEVITPRNLSWWNCCARRQHQDLPVAIGNSNKVTASRYGLVTSE